MPQNTFAPAFTSRFNPQPLVTVTPGEIDSARLERRLRLAQIQNLELQPQQEQRLFQEKQREFNVGQQHESDVLGETSRFHQGTLANEQDRTQIAKEQLASQIEQHKTEQNTAIVDTLMRTAPLLGLDKEDVGDVLNRMGHSELAAHFAATHEQEQAKKVAQVKTDLATGVIKENEVDPTILQQIKSSDRGQGTAAQPSTNLPPRFLRRELTDEYGFITPKSRRNTAPPEGGYSPTIFAATPTPTPTPSLVTTSTGAPLKPPTANFNVNTGFIPGTFDFLESGYAERRTKRLNEERRKRLGSDFGLSTTGQ